MKRFAIGLFVLGFAVCLAPAAWAALIPITAVDGTWSNAVPAGVVIDNSVDPRTARWGTPPQGGSQSGYNWGPSATPFNADSSGTPFSLGTFDHLNFPIGAPVLQSIQLDFSMTIDALAPLSGAFSFTHNETPNAPPCNPPGITPCPDVVTVASPFLNTPFNYLGTDYFFSLLGFSQDGGATIKTQFVTEEGLQNTAQLYAVITETPISIPEPASLLLLASGLAALGRFAWSRKR